MQGYVQMGKLDSKSGRVVYVMSIIASVLAIFSYFSGFSDIFELKDNLLPTKQPESIATYTPLFKGTTGKEEPGKSERDKDDNHVSGQNEITQKEVIGNKSKLIDSDCNEKRSVVDNPVHDDARVLDRYHRKKLLILKYEASRELDAIAIKYKLEELDIFVNLQQVDENECKKHSTHLYYRDGDLHLAKAIENKLIDLELVKLRKNKALGRTLTLWIN